jgi:Cdc6-like AAA superfamily ATPase
MEIVENIDSMAEKAKNLKITKNDFIDCLRQVTQIKILSIKESKDIFEKRVQKLIKAQEYELTNQESQAIRTAQEVFVQQGQSMIKLFDKEAKLLQN